ncbi:MAG TPA: glutamate-1-semialdehyde 2,1-aminomutase [Methanothermobacter sp.]|uniref:Glutamate-1-semialdehyde 2,1-aminomutase n=1 Tax=Methanothermobacter tenebrarum TaxID=680118 RepID=A0ABM7YDU2_9EURY|nr:glutamate-1-semialdehyde 2,1-aminomutase [Methanothermobacter tenebrarum]MDX9693468.1 glutamate-1-semialdehyde 2,1-aminomutase [Methanothermobacter sp.]BDH79491.1 aspartate aminotransferase family protein [Methanothermobacter tenebrarum]HHW16573.1 glutamate-1-semialdehyde 2,1-aminomutase [Methanothermobacter sp.]HOQ20432.1 glutamate-1-semialdehyde 2,1-aminomutase [Methanothermobacter sp.]
MISDDLFKEALKVLPGGVSSPVRKFEPHPFFAKKGEGCILYDVDGNRYIDYCLAYGPLILGHAPEKITSAVCEQIKKGSAYGTPTKAELELAKLVIERVPSAEMIRFVNSGTEATMAAIRLARAFTGKDKILKFEGAYHGAHDYVLVKPGSGAAAAPDSPGIPQDTTRNTISAPFNDEEAVASIIEEDDNIAAILVEPVMANIGCIEPEDGYLKFLRKITSENGILLIFDEVITGFRIAPGGAQEYYNITADLVTYGKIIGGGFPMGALAGPRRLMEHISPAGDVYQAGTFNGNPVSVTAGITTLKELTDDLYKELNKKGEIIRKGIKDILEDNNLEFYLAGLSSMFQIYFTQEKVKDYTSAKTANLEIFKKYFHSLLKGGVFVPPSQFECCFISAAHRKEDLNMTLEVVEESIKRAVKQSPR